MVIVWRLRGNIIRTGLCDAMFLQVQQIGFVTLGPLRHA